MTSKKNSRGARFCCFFASRYDNVRRKKLARENFRASVQDPRFAVIGTNPSRVVLENQFCRRRSACFSYRCRSCIPCGSQSKNLPKKPLNKYVQRRFFQICAQHGSKSRISGSGLCGRVNSSTLFPFIASETPGKRLSAHCHKNDLFLAARHRFSLTRQRKTGSKPVPFCRRKKLACTGMQKLLTPPTALRPWWTRRERRRSARP